MASRTPRKVRDAFRGPGPVVLLVVLSYPLASIPSLQRAHGSAVPASKRRWTGLMRLSFPGLCPPLASVTCLHFLSLYFAVLLPLTWAHTHGPPPDPGRMEGVWGTKIQGPRCDFFTAANVVVACLATLRSLFRFLCSPCHVNMDGSQDSCLSQLSPRRLVYYGALRSLAEP